MQKSISPKITALTFGILVLVFAIGFYIFAWQEPTQAPPGGNVATPLNTSATPQTKAGDLTIGTVTIKGDGSVSPNLNSQKIGGFTAADIFSIIAPLSLSCWPKQSLINTKKEAEWNIQITGGMALTQVSFSDGENLSGTGAGIKKTLYSALGTKTLAVTASDKSGQNKTASCSLEVKDFKYVFLSTSHPPNFGGLAAADAICQSVADTNGYKNTTFKAWLSDSKTAAKNRLAHATIPYYTDYQPWQYDIWTNRKANPQKIAENWADLVDGTLLTSIGSDWIWTNTTAQGEIFQTNLSYICWDWTLLEREEGGPWIYMGDGSKTDSRWTINTSIGAIACNIKANPFYCFQQ